MLNVSRLVPAETERILEEPSSFVTHAQQRASERYGIDITKSDLRAIAHQIRAARIKQRLDDEDREIWIVVHADVEMFAVYDPKSVKIVTFLDPRTVFVDGSIDLEASLEAGMPDHRSNVVRELMRKDRER